MQVEESERTSSEPALASRDVERDAEEQKRAASSDREIRRDGEQDEEDVVHSSDVASDEELGGFQCAAARSSGNQNWRKGVSGNT